jgi:hypothetical protein
LDLYRRFRRGPQLWFTFFFAKSDFPFAAPLDAGDRHFYSRPI